MSEVHAEGCANRQITPIRSKWFRLQDQTFYQQEKEKKRNKRSRNSQRNTGAGAKMTFLKYQHIILVSPDGTVLEEYLTLLSTCRMLPSRCFCGISELWQPAYPPPNMSTTWAECFATLINSCGCGSRISLSERCWGLRPSWQAFLWNWTTPKIPFEGPVWLTCHCQWTCG